MHKIPNPYQRFAQDLVHHNLEGPAEFKCPHYSENCHRRTDAEIGTAHLNPLQFKIYFAVLAQN
jgi:hypothetical protein